MKFQAGLFQKIKLKFICLWRITTEKKRKRKENFSLKGNCKKFYFSYFFNSRKRREKDNKTLENKKKKGN